MRSYPLRLMSLISLRKDVEQRSFRTEQKKKFNVGAFFKQKYESLRINAGYVPKTVVFACMLSLFSSHCTIVYLRYNEAKPHGNILRTFK
jgi:hypothetical protein